MKSTSRFGLLAGIIIAVVFVSACTPADGLTLVNYLPDQSFVGKTVAEITDKATIKNPKQLSEGIAGVWVSGERVWSDGAVTSARPGVLVSREGSQQ